jgi:hypothetical protein
MAMMPSDAQTVLGIGVLMKSATVAVIFGLGAGMIRERSHSLLPAWLFHATAIATSLLAYGTA